MRLFEIRVIVEADDEKDAEQVTGAIALAICPLPHDDEPIHVCPRGWITMTSELDEHEAAIWREPDALNR
jgi:hypothetical protein